MDSPTYFSKLIYKLVVLFKRYHLTNDPFGKKDGWYDYDNTAGDEVEKLHLDHQDNLTMTVRFVHAETSGYTYKVSFSLINTHIKRIYFMNFLFFY